MSYVQASMQRQYSDHFGRYNPGDVAIIHPEASPADVESFLIAMGWANSADVPYTVEHTMLGMYTFSHNTPTPF